MSSSFIFLAPAHTQDQNGIPDGMSNSHGSIYFTGILKMVRDLGAHTTGVLLPPVSMMLSLPETLSGSSNEFSSVNSSEVSSIFLATDDDGSPPFSTMEVSQGVSVPLTSFTTSSPASLSIPATA